MKIKFVPQDVWLGLYWKTKHDVKNEQDWLAGIRTQTTTWYLCLIPCFPIIWTSGPKPY